MKIGLVGGYGFIGSHIAKSFDDVVIFEGFISGDHYDSVRALEDAFMDVDVIIDCAAYVSVRESYSEPDGYFGNNLNLAYAIGTFAKTHNKTVIYLQTSKVGVKLSPYTLSKHLAEDVYERLDVDLKVVHLPNVYGEGRLYDANGLIPAIVRGLVENSRVGLSTGPDEPIKRQFAHVDKVVDAVGQLLTTKAREVYVGGTWIGTFDLVKTAKVDFYFKDPTDDDLVFLEYQGNSSEEAVAEEIGRIMSVISAEVERYSYPPVGDYLIEGMPYGIARASKGWSRLYKIGRSPEVKFETVEFVDPMPRD